MATLTARQVADVFESIAPLDTALPGDPNGFTFGDPATEVRGIGCMWVAHSPAIRAAAEQNLNMLIIHEALLYRPHVSSWYKTPEEGRITANLSRQALLEKHGMVVYRSHSNWDALAVDGVPDQAMAALGLKGLRVVAEEKFFKVHELARPMTVAQLANRAKKGFDIPCARVFGDPKKTIRRFALLVGGFGGNQPHMPQVAAEMGAEAIILGEMSEFIVMAAQECGVPVIETLHSASEIPAIRRQAEILQERFPAIPARYIPSGAWHF